MKTAAELVDNVNHGQSTTTEKPGNTPNHSEQGMMRAWRALLAMKLVNEPIGSSDYKYWKHGVRDFSDEDLMRGVSAAKDFTGYFTLGEFRKLCVKPVAVPYHQPYNPNQIEHKGMTTDARKAAMKKLREETGL